MRHFSKNSGTFLLLFLQIGVTVLQNIIDCLDQSQVFITVLSPGYVNSTWCMFELFLAQSRMKQMSNLIVIVKQSIKDVSRLDKRLQVILKLWTYLPWPNAKNNENEKNLFWQRLTSCIKVQCTKDVWELEQSFRTFVWPRKPGGGASQPHTFTWVMPQKSKLVLSNIITSWILLARSAYKHNE